MGEKARLWSERIREFRSSGQTCRDWCTEQQIPVSIMTYWNRSSPPPYFRIHPD
ncbi:IS66 family insertion sequence element accessory protein TnpA [Parabacteroides goldsteinii]|uniref:IS66 family insertion sequence element accessory protein TnpA n=1 Tax=Parabacteroides goldsteinii TaxID=328812 RepID=UPI003D9BFE7A